LLLWLIETDVFQMPQLHKHFNVACNCEMTRLFIITFLFSLLSCRNNNSSQTYSQPDQADIIKIVEAVINDDSLSFHKRQETNQIPLSINLRKLQVFVPDTTSEVPPPSDLDKVSIFNLFNTLVDQQIFFARADSSYFLFQNNIIKTFTLDDKILVGIKMTTLIEQQQIDNAQESVNYYDLTIPILSADNKKAYVELTNNCSNCSGAIALFLQKEVSGWTVVGWQRRWMY
jgi:hypothetical protein